MKNVYPQAAATLNLLRASATGGYVAMQRVAQWNFDFSEHSEQSDGHMELAHRVAGVGLVGTDFGTGLVLIWSGLGVAAGLVLIWSGLGVAAGLVTSGLGAVTGGQDNFTNFVWDPGDHAKHSLRATVFQAVGNVSILLIDLLANERTMDIVVLTAGSSGESLAVFTFLQ
jgi:hypothetical protein